MLVNTFKKNIKSYDFISEQVNIVDIYPSKNFAELVSNILTRSFINHLETKMDK